MHLGLVLVAALAGANAPALPLPTPADTVPAFEHVRISPSGDRLLAIAMRGQHRVLAVTDAASGQSTLAYHPTFETQSLNGCEWVSDSRIVCAIFVYSEPGPPWPRERIARLVVVGHDGSEPLSIFPRPPRRTPKLAGVVPQPDLLVEGGFASKPTPRPFLDLEHYVVDLLPGDPDHLLVAAAREATPYRSVYRVNVHSGKSKRLVGWQPGIVFWHTDQQGRVRAGTGWYEFGSGLPPMFGRSPKEPFIGPTGVTRDAGDWHRIDLVPLSWGVAARHLTIPRVLGFSGDGNRVYLQAAVDGADRTAVWEATADMFEPLRQVARSDTHDVSARVVAGQDCGVVGFMHPIPERRFTWLAPAFGADVERADERLPDEVVAVTSMSADCQLVTLASTDQRSQRRFHLLDRSTGQLRGLGKQYPELDGARTERRTVTWTARDGLALPMVLTVPSEGPPEGLVVLLRDSAVQDPLATLDVWPHYLARRGYAVAEPVFRGKNGFGRTMHAAGLGRFAQQFREDIADAVSWLAERKIADPERVCFLGRGRGGHLALLAALPLAAGDAAGRRCAAAFAIMDVRQVARAHDNPFEPVFCGNRFACGGWEHWAAQGRMLANVERDPAFVEAGRAWGGTDFVNVIEATAPAPQSSFRSPLPDAKHPGFPVLVHGAESRVHDGDGDEWQADLEALGFFDLVAPHAAEPETDFLREATTLFDQVLKGYEPVPSDR